MKNILITFSGGRTSAFMSALCKERYKDDNLLFVFANTGKERPETLKFVNQCDKYFNLNLVWLEADISQEKGKGTGYKIVDFETANRNGQPFENAIKKYGLPSKLYRHCTRELKEVPIHKFVKEVFKGDYVTALGIRADEPHRQSNKKNVIYPLAETNITEKFIREWWEKQPFDLQLKDYQGNCDLCFLKSKRKRMTLISEFENIAHWWGEMEQKYANERCPMFDVRGNLTIEDLVEMAQQPFEKATDKHELRKQMPEFDFELDTEFNCYCNNV
ncbi:phosphoadenosine phosphosulfate reductase domain-containing protein [Capnocytophaga canimorsus]|uniref:phosphoadenosine phosphosulfate reductase domain-containing protein n=1 Tax=Capnocytophaga canimorsus TaxID=28188 RepID=UPI0028E41C41|nr:phosphoadenosine phosphosulfate reductase family protein [Capnocytophaga canimorsus]MDT9499160.1 phosphoadenosine phosphosulfate reductase family protein [Capnocytophaga canimorsus]